MKTIAIIGGGAAGLAAAVAAVENRAETVQVTVYEAADRIGKTILATGNGRCNFSNALIGADKYRNAQFVGQSFLAMPPSEAFAFFKRLGLVWHEEGEGRLYPLSNKATSVLDVLRSAARKRGVLEVCGCEVMTVTPVEERYLVSCTDHSTFYADAVILACGGAVARSIVPPSYTYRNTEPVLGPLATDSEPIKGLNNIRVRCAISLLKNSAQQKKDEYRADLCDSEAKNSSIIEVGEVLFRDYGVSGIAVFNLSRFARAGDMLSINFLPRLNEQELRNLLTERLAMLDKRSAADFFVGMLQAPVARAVLKAAHLPHDQPLAVRNLETVASVLEGFSVTVQGIGDFRQCQVHRGGFEVGAFDPLTMESKTNPGLFMVGEALDVDAPCGGYNLHWAWSSGLLAGRAVRR